MVSTLTSSMPLNFLGKFYSLLMGRYSSYICFPSAVQITRYILLYIYGPDSWGWQGGELGVVISFDNSELEMGHQSDGPTPWAGKENLFSVSPAWCLKPPQLMAWEQGGKFCPRGDQLGLVCCSPWCRKAAGVPGWVETGQMRSSAWEICAPKPFCLARGFSSLLERVKAYLPWIQWTTKMSKGNQYTVQYEFNVCKPHCIFNQLYIYCSEE